MDAPVRKIAFVLPNFQAGGAERVMITIANNLDRARFRPVLIVFDAHGPLRDLVAPDIAVHALNAPRVRSGLGAFVKAVRHTGADLVISTMAHLNIAVLLARPFLGGVPVLVREAVTPSFFSGNPLKRLVLLAGYHLLYPFADAILSPTQMVFDEMPAILRRRSSRLHRIFNPVDESFIRQAAPDLGMRADCAAPAQRLFVGAGRLVDQKGFDRLIAALQAWKDRDDWRLIILGDGPDRAHLQALAERLELPQVTLTGFEPRPWRYFAVADAFVLPSRYEGLPNVSLEALALGAPVIAAASAGGIGEIAAAAGVGAVAVAGDMDEFTARMDKVAPAAEQATPRASLLPDCFSLPAVVASYERLFDTVLSRRAAARDA